MTPFFLSFLEEDGRGEDAGSSTLLTSLHVYVRRKFGSLTSDNMDS